MHRTTILLPRPLRMQLERAAQREAISFGELVRRVLQKFLLKDQGAASNDPFFANHTTFEDRGPRDVARQHDTYLVKDPH